MLADYYWPLYPRFLIVMSLQERCIEIPFQTMSSVVDFGDLSNCNEVRSYYSLLMAM